MKYKKLQSKILDTKCLDILNFRNLNNGSTFGTPDKFDICNTNRSKSQMR